MLIRNSITESKKCYEINWYAEHEKIKKRNSLNLFMSPPFPRPNIKEYTVTKTTTGTTANGILKQNIAQNTPQTSNQKLWNSWNNFFKKNPFFDIFNKSIFFLSCVYIRSTRAVIKRSSFTFTSLLSAISTISCPSWAKLAKSVEKQVKHESPTTSVPWCAATMTYL